ncbi:MAG TPA: hypothetical protein PKV72_00040 [Candidatus Peribacteria bacterium]|nr:hypothetical protein [Candidatus Peribacteria bacterium]
MSEVLDRTPAAEAIPDEAGTAVAALLEECDVVGADAMAILHAAEVRAKLGIPSDYDVRQLDEAGTVFTVTIPDRAPTPGTRSIGGDKILALRWNPGDVFVTLDGKSMPVSALPNALCGHDKALNWSAIQGLDF